MAGSRKSTPRRGRSASVASDAGSDSAKPNSKAKAKSPKSPRAPPKSPKSPTSASKKAAVSSPKPKPSSQTSEKRSTTKSKFTAAQQAAIANRHALPIERNPRLPNEDVPVKLQIIRREGANIIIGRVKLPTTNGSDHAFLLKRFDTNAIAASSMFRLAFPYANGEQERSEMEYLERRYDANAANGGTMRIYKRSRGKSSKHSDDEQAYDDILPEGSTGVRLQGTWISCADGLELSKEYGLERFARPLIEAKASTTEEGVPILTPSANDKVSTPTSGRSAKLLKQARDEMTDASPSAVRATKRTKEDGSQEVIVESSTTGKGLTASQMEKQIRDSQALAKGIQANSSTPVKASRKRRAANQSPSSRNDPYADEDYENANIVVRSTRAARRRPIVATAGALGAVGAGTLAWLSGGNFDVAAQLLQQGVANLSSFFY